MDENLLFIALIVIFLVCIMQKYPRFIVIAVLTFVVYNFYKKHYSTPRDFINSFQTYVKEAFEPCTMNNQSYCGNETNSNMTILPDIMRSPSFGNNINRRDKVVLSPENYKIDKRLKLGIKEITMDEIYNSVPILVDFKDYLEKIVKFTLTIKTDDPVQKDYLAKKLLFNMTKIFYNAYNTVMDKSYPIQTYNELLFSQREFNDTLNIFVFLALNNTDTHQLDLLQKTFNELNKKLNQFIIEKVNSITPNDYNITTSLLPVYNEPQPMNA